MKDLFESTTSEQKLSILLNEARTPTEVIRGYSNLIKQEIEANNIKPEALLEGINTIAENANRIKKLLDVFVDISSPGFPVLTDDKISELADSYGSNQIPANSSPEYALEIFDNELKHFLASSGGCVEMLSLYANDEAQQYLLSILSKNLVLVNHLRIGVQIYLESYNKEK